MLAAEVLPRHPHHRQVLWLYVVHSIAMLVVYQHFGVRKYNQRLSDVCAHLGVYLGASPRVHLARNVSRPSSRSPTRCVSQSASPCYIIALLWLRDGAIVLLLWQVSTQISILRELHGRDVTDVMVAVSFFVTDSALSAAQIAERYGPDHALHGCAPAPISGRSRAASRNIVADHISAASRPHLGRMPAGASGGAILITGRA